VNRVWIGVWVAVLAAVGLGFGWFVMNPFVMNAEEPAFRETTVALETREGKPPEVARFPGEGYELAQVRSGKRVEIFDRPGGDVVKRLGARTEFDSPRVLPVLKPKRRWLGIAAPELGNGAVGWVRYDRKLLALGDTRISLRVDLSERAVELRHGDKVIRDVIVSVGRLGAETPTGRFAVTDVLDLGLDPVYGAGAIALSARQPSLPAGWIGGDRIAIHGWAGPVGEAASGGCLRTANEDVEALLERLPLGAPVFISS
jgi:hypothetical protein